MGTVRPTDRVPVETARLVENTSNEGRKLRFSPQLQ